VLARLPRHRERLRRDAALSEALEAQARALPGPSPDAVAYASTRLRNELHAQRRQREEASRGLGWLRGFGLPRIAFAFTVLVIAVVGLSVMAGGGQFDSYLGGGTAEAAVLEGVVVDNSDGRLILQTLDGLEKIKVPHGIPMSDTRGVVIEFAGIKVGEVVVVRGNRQAGDLIAAQVERLAEGLEGWCENIPGRCRALSGSLDHTEKQCRAQPRACNVMLDRLQDVSTRASGIVNLQDLRGNCRAGTRNACQDVLNFCSREAALCERIGAAGNLPEVTDRLRELSQACREGDALSCRLLTQLCEASRLLCTDATPSSGPPRQR
jgi:hypothetical protein